LEQLFQTLPTLASRTQTQLERLVTIIPAFSAHAPLLVDKDTAHEALSPASLNPAGAMYFVRDDHTSTEQQLKFARDIHKFVVASCVFPVWVVLRTFL
jgi:hypothetical protein